MSTAANRPRVLCVDDESRVLEGLTLHLRRDYEVHTASGAAEGMAKLADPGGFMVVLSDMRMPRMDGATFLANVMRRHPEVTRMLLTGDAGRDSAADAVNKGQIFRFLTKPCPPDQLKAAVEAAIMQHRLYTAERRILQETLLGCINALVDVLAITNPVAFGRASRIKRIAMEFASELGCAEGYWQLEAAAMLSQIGFLSLPTELVERIYYGERLTPEEKLLASAAPEVAVKLLEQIPRLEPVLQILNALNQSDDQLARLGDGTIGQGARILGLVLEYDGLIAQGNSADLAVQMLRARSPRYGAEFVEQFARRVGVSVGTDTVTEVALRHVRPGMTILQDVHTHLGQLLVPRGFEVTEAFLERMKNFGPGLLAETVRVLVPGARVTQAAAI